MSVARAFISGLQRKDLRAAKKQPSPPARIVMEIGFGADWGLESFAGREGRGSPPDTVGVCVCACLGFCNIAYDASIIHSCFLISSVPMLLSDPQEPVFPWRHL